MGGLDERGDTLQPELVNAVHMHALPFEQGRLSQTITPTYNGE